MAKRVSQIKKTLLNFNQLINIGAAKVAALDDDTQMLKAAHLTKLHLKGDRSNPFIESDSLKSNDSAATSPTTQHPSSNKQKRKLTDEKDSTPTKKNAFFPIPAIQPVPYTTSSVQLPSPSSSVSYAITNQYNVGTSSTTAMLPSTTQFPPALIPMPFPTPYFPAAAASAFPLSPSPSPSSSPVGLGTTSFVGSAANSFGAFLSSPTSSLYPPSTPPLSPPSPSYSIPHTVSSATSFAATGSLPASGSSNAVQPKSNSSYQIKRSRK